MAKQRVSVALSMSKPERMLNNSVTVSMIQTGTGTTCVDRHGISNYARANIVRHATIVIMLMNNMAHAGDVSERPASVCIDAIEYTVQSFGPHRYRSRRWV